ncbi:MAG: GntR family transcriptional regulator [Eubacteriales bacterium]
MSKPLHEIIFNSIRDDINRGTYKVAEMLPSENTLAKSFNTTRMTVRNALIRLTDEGYIYSVAGKGYYIKEKKYNKYSFTFDETKIMNTNIEEAKLISVDIIKPDVDLSYNLRLPGDSRIVAIKRLLYIKGKKVAYDEKFIPYYSGIPIIESEINYATLPEIISNRESLFSMKKKLMITVMDSSPDIMEVFNFLEPQSIFRVEQTILDDEGEPIAWAKITYLMDYFHIDAKLILNK